MDAYKTHGSFSWSELITADPEQARAFSSRLFGWTTEAMDMPEGAYHVIKVGGTSMGGIMATPPGAAGMPPMWGCYVTVDNVDDTVRQCVQLGGSVLVPVMDVPGVGRMAVIRDPAGAALNVITYTS